MSIDNQITDKSNVFKETIKGRDSAARLNLVVIFLKFLHGEDSPTPNSWAYFYDKAPFQKVNQPLNLPPT